MPTQPHPADIGSLVEDLLQSTGALQRRLRRETNPDGLTWSQISALARLHRDGPITTADLARIEGVKPQSMGATLVALEQEGLVTRTPDARDGRQLLYSLTEAGIAVQQRRRLMKRAWLSAALSGLDEQDARALADAVAILRRLGSQ